MDGSFGPATLNAVISFQLSYGLAPDGVVGPLTRAKLYEVSPGPSPDRNYPKADALKGKVIIIDPGHGGYDPGASQGGVYEKNLALDIGLKLRTMLERAGATVYMTREDDRYVSLFYRSAFANRVVLDMEIQAQQKEKDKAAEILKKKQAEIIIAREDITSLEEYREALYSLKSLAVQDTEEQAVEILDKIEQQTALVNDIRNSLRQEIKDQVHLGNETLTVEHLSELDNIINSLESVLKSVRAQTEALEQEIQAKNKKISACNSEIAELKKLLSGFHYYFDNPSYKERTGIYKYGASKTASKT